MIVDLCPSRDDYYTQLNNEFDPKISCQVTAAVQCLDIVDKSTVRWLGRNGQQPEDELRMMCVMPDMLDFCIRSHGSDWHRHVDHPSEWGDVLVRAINVAAGYNAATFFGSTTVDVVVNRLRAGFPMMCSMRYPHINGHYVSVVGVDTARCVFIVNDPYMNTKERKDDGWHNEYTFDEFTRHHKGHGVWFQRRV